MKTQTTEQVSTEEEQEDTTSEAETEEQTEVAEEKTEGEGEEKEAPEAEEEDFETKFQDRLKDEYAKWQSKTLSPVVKERDELRKQLEVKQDKSLADEVFGQALEDGDEAAAKKRKEAVEEVNKRYRHIKGKEAEVETAKTEYEAKHQTLENYERHQKAVERAHAILMPHDKEYTKARDAIVAELEQAETPEEMERRERLILRERQGKEKPFKPDSGRNSGGESLKNASPLDLIAKGLNQESKRR